MRKLHRNLATILILVLGLINELTGSGLETKVPLKEPILTDGSKPVSVSRRQVNPSSFGYTQNSLTAASSSNNHLNHALGNSNNYFFNNPPPPQQSQYNSNNNYDMMRSNHLNYRDSDPYHPSSSSYPSYGTGRSGISSGNMGVGSVSNGGNYYDHRNRDRDYRDRQPYYDDYRYNRDYERDRELALAQSREYNMRNGQLRHQEYQKRIGQNGQEFYDPFYFIGMRNADPSPSSVPYSPLVGGGGSSSGLITPQTSVLPSPASTGSLNPPSVSSSSSPAAAPLRNRRNSHQRPNDFLFSNDINGGKYDIMTAKSAYPSLNHHQSSNNRPRWPNHHLDQQFLTREQLVRHRPDSRVPYPLNYMDQYGSSATSGGRMGGQPWSVRIGTQLKVNDDGRSPNPHRFYVRDEMNKSRSRYQQGPIYRRRK